MLDSMQVILTRLTHLDYLRKGGHILYSDYLAQTNMLHSNLCRVNQILAEKSHENTTLNINDVSLHNNDVPDSPI